MKLSLFDYNLPKELIAQKQIKPRDHSRLLILKSPTTSSPAVAGVTPPRAGGDTITHDYFYNLDKYLDSNDVLVFNDSKVMPARIRMYKETGGKVEVFLLKELTAGKWEVMIGGKVVVKTRLRRRFAPRNDSGFLKCEIIEKLDNGNWVVKFNLKGKKFREVLEKIGETPLPPYIKTKDSKQIRKDYQTIYAHDEGSVAAPTAGLHFTKRVFEKLKKKGVKIEFVTLHVGLGTFQPVKTNEIEKHQMHAEYVVLDQATTKRLNNYKKEGKRIVAVGTTSCRVLEAMSLKNGKLKTGAKDVNIFIYPGYKFKFVDEMITNFHLPKSTLLMLVSALAGRENILKAYKLAVKKKYRFYSFGDGMIIK